MSTGPGTGPGGGERAKQPGPSPSRGDRAPADGDSRGDGRTAAGATGGHTAHLPIGSISWMPAMQTAAVAPQQSDATRARDAAARGDALYQQNQFRAALPWFAEAVRLQPAEAKYHFGLAAAAWQADQRALVEPHLLDAVRLNVNHAAAHDALGQWYLVLNDVARARRHSAAAVALEPGNADFAVSHAFALMAAGDAAAAWALVEPIAAAGAVGPQLATLYAQLAPKVGREQEAVEVLGRALAAPGFAQASASGRSALHFAAATLFERLGRYDDAFAQARLANGITRRPYDPDAHSQSVTRQIAYFTPERLRALPRATRAGRGPVLILGMPRSGTSLVEQILDTHPAVAGRGELGALARIATALDAADAEMPPYPQSMDLLSIRAADRLAGDYLDALRNGLDAARRDAVYLTDKTPLNFLTLGLAEVLLPRCRIIHCVRNPMDTCLSCYFTNFAFGNHFSTDLGHLGAFYRDYRRLMEHWKQVLSLPILDVRYEDLALDPEGQTRRMLEFLELPWDDRCLRFHENPRPVATASKYQVRQPVYLSSVGRWKHYEKHLGELMTALGRTTEAKNENA